MSWLRIFLFSGHASWEEYICEEMRGRAGEDGGDSERKVKWKRKGGGEWEGYEDDVTS